MSEQSKVLYLNILWHMHQPYYKDGLNSTFVMPWVFMHAIKDYHEMAAHLDNETIKGKIKVNINYVPSLTSQLKEYENPYVKDDFLTLLRKPVNSLSDQDLHALLKQLSMLNKHTMLDGFNRLEIILEKYKNRTKLSHQEILDASVLYLLAWTGRFLRKQDVPSKLINKGSNFTEEDKQNLLNFYAESIKQIVPIHKKLEEQGVIELSCTPECHPILPLLADFNAMRESMPNEPMPKLAGSFGKDFQEHIQLAIKSHKEVFGKTPVGLWPSEGSVSPLVVDYLSESDFKWTATDEDILIRSIGIDLKHYPARQALYRRYYFEGTKNKINVFFRDKQLSDLIGFTYSSWNPKDAVSDFIQKLKGIYDNCSFSPNVSVILDGENAWEFYRNNAFDFFTELYSSIANCSWIKSCTMSESSAMPSDRLPRLASGSWIYGNFAIWCGNSEKNRAWELLSQTRKQITDLHGDKIPEELSKKLHIAEGSDWFWWYGDDHFTIQADQFDKLFRSYLISIYQMLNVSVPGSLLEPIKKNIKSGYISPPSRQLLPVIDGSITSFYEWLGAGEFDLVYDEGSMHSGGGMLNRLKYGYGEKDICLCIYPKDTVKYPSQLKLRININGVPYNFELEKGIKSERKGISICFNSVIEITLPFELAFKDKSASLSFETAYSSGAERAPRYSDVILKHPLDTDIEWMV